MASCRVSSPDIGRACITIECGTHLSLDAVQLYPCYNASATTLSENGIGIKALQSTTLSCWNISGKTNFFLRTMGAVVTWGGTRPWGDWIDGSIPGDLGPDSIFSPADLTPLPTDPPDPVAPDAPPTVTETTLSPTRLQCFGNSSWDNSLYYGAWRDNRGTTTRYSTCAWYNVPRTTSSTTIKINDASLTLKRNSNSGGSSAITMWVYTTSILSDSQSDPKTSMQYVGVLGPLEKGDTYSMSSSALIAAIQSLADNGGALMLYASSTNDPDPTRNESGSSNYAKLEGSFDLNVVYTTTTN